MVPDTLPNERFGIRLVTLIGILKTMGLSYGKISVVTNNILIKSYRISN